jgi:hypothetical protein
VGVRVRVRVRGGVECIHTLVRGRRDAWEIDRSVSLLLFSVFAIYQVVCCSNFPPVKNG